ncbi:MAG: putative bifunctional diguanylate cyclase/phosphodiesterase, partial [Candidatus Dormibacteria bacterium]
MRTRSISPARQRRAGSAAGAFLDPREHPGLDRRPSRPRGQEILRAALASTGDLVIACDSEGRIAWANPAMRRFAGLSGVGRLPRAWVAQESVAAGGTVAGVAELLLRALAGERMTEIEVKLESSTVGRRSLAVSGQRLLSGDGVLRGAVLMCHDITAEKDLEARLSLRGQEDPLTRLPHPDLFGDNLQILLGRVGGNYRAIAVLAINLDHFSHMSNRLGKEVGERVLVQVGQRLKDTLRTRDSGSGTLNIATRLGGDQFLVLYDGIADIAAAERAAGRIQPALRAPLPAGATTLSLTAGIGIALTADPSKDPGALILEAQTAMRVAKRLGGDRHECFVPEMETQLQARLDNAEALNQALDRGEFRVVYQPKVSLLTDAISGVEALLRWQHPVRGEIQPMDFIPLAEESGLIIPMGRWVMEQVCRDATQWATALPGGLPLPVAVNVSARQFEPGLAETFNTVIEQCGIDPQTICLEVTESMLIRDAELAVATLRKLKTLGTRISIDD